MEAIQRDGPPAVPGLPLFVLAAAVIVLVGIHLASGIVGPVFLAIVLSIVLSPIRNFLVQKKWPRTVATALVLALAIGVLVVGVWAVYLMTVQLLVLLPSYEAAFTDLVDSIQNFVIGAGINIDAVQLLKESVNFQDIKNVLAGMFSGILSVLTNIVFLISLLLFMSLDSDGISTKLFDLKSPQVSIRRSLYHFKRSTQTFLTVTTSFGAGIALLDVLVLYILGIPLPWLWGLLAFATNFIPNIGFIIGVIPPALLALLGHDFPTMLILIVSYSAINVLVQSIIQTKVVGKAVGLNLTVSFLSLILWTWILGPLGAVLAVPLTIFVFSFVFAGDSRKYKWARAFVES